MNQTKLNHASPIPLYYQLKEIFNAKIEKEEWLPGQLIPTENELIAYYEVSRTTVREAVNALVQEGKLEKKQGKGTSVCKPKMEERLGKLTGFAEEMLRIGLTPGARVVEMRKLMPPRNVREKLLGDDSEQQVLYIKRIRLASGEPIAIESSYWPLAIGAFFEGRDLTNIAFYSVIEENGVRLRDADEQISAKSASEDDAVLLGIDENDPLLRMERVAYSTTGTPIEYTFTDYRSDRYMYRVRLER